MGAEESKNYSFAPILLPTVSGLIDSWRFDSRGHRQENGDKRIGPQKQCGMFSSFFCPHSFVDS
jgi:hypothetical protein